MAEVDDYFDGLEAPSREAFERVRRLAVEQVPDSEQGTSYGMAALKYHGKPLLGFRAAKAHLSIFPFSAEVVEAVQDRLAGHDVSKGTIRFSAGQSIPDEVIRDIVRLRSAEIAR